LHRRTLLTAAKHPERAGSASSGLHQRSSLAR
jgi:hypothetical protein